MRGDLIFPICSIIAFMVVVASYLIYYTVSTVRNEIANRTKIKPYDEIKDFNCVVIGKQYYIEFSVKKKVYKISCTINSKDRVWFKVEMAKNNKKNFIYLGGQWGKYKTFDKKSCGFRYGRDSFLKNFVNRSIEKGSGNG